MDLLFDLAAVQEGVTSYDKMIEDTRQILDEVRILTEKIPQKTWSGDGREAFQKAFETWKNRTEFVLADMKKTRESLVGYAANKGIELKEKCERFGEVYE